MNHIWQVFSYELKRNIRRRGFLFMTFGVPLIAIVLLVGYQFITDLNRSEEQDAAAQTALMEAFRGINKAGYVDLSGVFAAPDGELGKKLVVYPDEPAALAALAAGEIDVYYVIAADYLDTGSVMLNVPRFSMNQMGADPIEQLVYHQLASDTDPALFERLRYPSNIQEINPARDSGALNEGSRFAVVFIFSITLMLGVFLTSGYLMQSVIEEKETRLIEILISTVRPVQLLVGKILGLGMLGIIQIAVWLVGLFLLVRVAGILNSPLLFLVNLSIPWDIVPVILVYFVLGYLFFAAAYGVVGALSNSMQEGPQYAVVFTLPAALPYYFQAVFAQSPDAALPVVLSLFPITSPLAMVMRMAIAPVPAWQIIASLTILALSVVGMMWLAGRLFRVQSLLAGQVPKLRDIPKLIRG